MLRIALTILQFFCALAIIGLVLIQRGKGAEAGAGFGAGASGTVFGARGAGTALSRATAVFAALFMLNSLALGYVGSHQTERPKTIFDTAGETPGAPAARTPAAPPLAPAPGANPQAPSSGALPTGAPGPATNAPTQNAPSTGATSTGATSTQTPAAPAPK
ncbi:MAG TPA: preprotein translocase subunit SecG [Steroidobacteraceae bacterium]|nr:preprotein translocase subunit SecG [Steroidobacteraceae bacterium]